jgi:pimeloyl-ACP methyl ester carboxylesterase
MSRDGSRRFRGSPVDLVVREYGRGTELVIALHGGPGAAGDVAPLARALGKQWHVFEPFQRGSGERRLTVASHVQDLDDLISERCGTSHPVLVGHSWGAMLALAYAAAHPSTPAALALIGCGTFSLAARAEFEARLAARLTPTDRTSIARVDEMQADADHRLAALGRLMTRVYAHDLEDIPGDVATIDAAAHDQTWEDMLRLQHEGVYPAAFAAISAPILMLHGDADPHPGRLICEDLRRHVPQLEYQEVPRCGHSPWLERQAKAVFFELLGAWLEARLNESTQTGRPLDP